VLEDISMREAFLLLSAAILEVGGDALIRTGLKGGGLLFMLMGAAILVGYGFMVNLTHLDFGRPMGMRFSSTLMAKRYLRNGR
jgi:drug/metabolite transporter superfamily protein YnfA